MIRALIVFAVASTVCLTGFTAFEAHATLNYGSADRKVAREVKAMKRKGLYPASMRCDQDPAKKYLSPDVSFDWRENVNDIDWVVYAYKGQLEFWPGNPGSKEWRQVSKKVINVGGGRYYCMIYYKK